MASTIFPPDRVTIIGALNLTPDSFFYGGGLLAAGGRLDRDALALRRARG